MLILKVRKKYLFPVLSSKKIFRNSPRNSSPFHSGFFFPKIPLWMFPVFFLTYPGFFFLKISQRFRILWGMFSLTLGLTSSDRYFSKNAVDCYSDSTKNLLMKFTKKKVRKICRNVFKYTFKNLVIVKMSCVKL